MQVILLAPIETVSSPQFDEEFCYLQWPNTMKVNTMNFQLA